MVDRLGDQQAFRRVIWLLPLAFASHIAEEYLGNFPGWVKNVVGGSFNNEAFAANNAAFFAIMVALTAWTSRTGSRRASTLLILWASGNVFWDALFHVGMTAATDRYSPGLVTAAILYLPISPIVAFACVASGTLTPAAFARACGGGLFLFAFVVWYGLFHFALP